MKLLSSLAGGLAGAVAVTLLNEFLRKDDEDAPRLDRLGEEALSESLESFDLAVPEGDALFKSSLVGDILSNLLYYSLAGFGKNKNVWMKGLLLGLGAGFGAVKLPKPLGLNEETTNKTTKTKAMTMGYYIIGGVVSSLVMALLEGKKEKKLS